MSDKPNMTECQYFVSVHILFTCFVYCIIFVILTCDIKIKYHVCLYIDIGILKSIDILKFSIRIDTQMLISIDTFNIYIYKKEWNPKF